MAFHGSRSDTTAAADYAKTFVKMRVRSPVGMNVEAIELENYYSPFSIR